MSVLNIPVFAGMVPAMDPRMLDSKNASMALNTYMYSGAVRGFAQQVRINKTDFLASTTTVFRIPANLSDPGYLYDSYWLEFTDVNTDVILAPSAGDSFTRYYWTAPSHPPMYNTRDRIIAGQPAWILGLDQPGKPNVVVSGGSSTTIISRAYIATMVTEYGEEGPASDPFLVENAKEDATFTVTVPGVPAGDLGVNRNVKKVRLYRTVVSTNATASYYLVHEWTATTAPMVFADTLSDIVIASKPTLESTLWTAPPALEGWATMPNGIVVGFKGKELWFSEPYRPHAWPVAYTLLLNFDIVGIGVIGQTAVICTEGNPYTASGINSFSMATSMLASFEPCLAKGSILPTEEGVYYMSPNGLILVNAGRAENITKQFITRDWWNKLTNNGKANAARFGPAYYALSGSLPGGIFDDSSFQIAGPAAFQSGTSASGSKGFMVDPTNLNMGFVMLEKDASIVSIQNDYYSSELIYVHDRAAWWLDRNPGFKTDPYLWRSKIFQAPLLKNFTAMKVFFDVEDANHVTHSGPQDFYKYQEYDPVTKCGVVRLYADGVLVYAAEIRTSGQLFRLPSGFKADFWEIEIEGVKKVFNIQMATSVKELSVA